MVKINMIEKISYYLAKKIYMCSEADVTCVVDEKNEDVQVLQYGIGNAFLHDILQYNSEVLKTSHTKSTLGSTF